MVQTQPLAQSRFITRSAKTGASVVIVLALAVAFLAACVSPATFSALKPETTPMPKFEPEAERFISFDGAELGLTVWQTRDEPEIVVVGVHGMNDFAGAFHMAAPYWAERGVMTYAYDQRGFGRSVGRGDWPDEELMREDLRAAVKLARAAHPDATLAVVGISMGAAAVMTAFASERPPEGVDRIVLSGPGLRGWGTMPLVQRAALWTSVRVRPGWVVVPPKFVKIEPSDNTEMLRRTWSNPLMIRSNKIEQVHGVVTLMENAHKAAPRLPSDVPTLLTYGARDIVIPDKAMRRTAKHLPAHVRTVYYPNGYHMILRDLQAELVFDDTLAFLREPEGDMPSGLGEIPGRN